MWWWVVDTSRCTASPTAKEDPKTYPKNECTRVDAASTPLYAVKASPTTND